MTHTGDPVVNTEKKEICDELIPESLTMLINYGILSLLTVQLSMVYFGEILFVI